MNQSAIIGLLAAVIILGGGIWLFESGTLDSSTTATSTPSGVNEPANNTVGAPYVTTGTLVVSSNSSAVMTGKVNPSGAQTSYWYEYGRTASLDSRSAAQAVGSGFANISAPAFVNGLAANSTYYYRLVAENSYGQVNGATLSFETNDNPPPTGSSPTARTDAATLVTRTSATLSGRVNPDSSETSYWFEYGETTDLGSITSFQSAGAGSASVAESVSVSGLKPATKYYYRINAQNQFGTVTGTRLSFTTSGPSAASAPTADTTSATAVTRTSATLNGKVNPNGDSTSYWFEYGTDSLLGTILGSTTHKVIAGSGTSEVNASTQLTGISANTTYWYRVVSMNTLGPTRQNV